MPLYDFRCPKGHTFEVSRGIEDDPLPQSVECAECGAAAERVFSTPAASVAGASTYGNTSFSAQLPKGTDAAAPGKAEQKEEGASWLDSREPDPPSSKRRGLRRN